MRFLYIAFMILIYTALVSTAILFSAQAAVLFSEGMARTALFYLVGYFIIFGLLIYLAVKETE